MTMIQTILLFAVLAIWLCISAVILISSIQSFLYDRKREKREREQAARDAEYHENRMKLLEKESTKPQGGGAICRPIGVWKEVTKCKPYRSTWRLTATSPLPKPVCIAMWSLPILKYCSLPTAWMAVPYSR